MLLAAAVDLFLTQGVDATSMDQVRSAAGASNGSLYHHFPTRNHLARTIYEAALRDYQANLRAALSDKVSAQQGVQSLVKRHIAWVQRSPQHARVLHELRASTAIDGHEPAWEQINAAAYSSIKAWIARHVAEGTLQDLPFEVWMALVFGPVLQLTPRWAQQEGARVPPRVINALAQAAWRSVSVSSD
jgi:AcrR family transcriptional regulator